MAARGIRIVDMKIITFGELLLRFSPSHYAKIREQEHMIMNVGGAEANVAVSLSNMGLDVHYISRVPSNELTQFCIRDLAKNLVKIDHMQYGGKRLGLYFVESGNSVRSGKVIYDREDSSFAEITPGMIDWEEVMKGADWFHWTGITPALSLGAAYACQEAIQKAKELGLTVSGDLNYRKKLWNYEKTPNQIIPGFIDKTDVLVCDVNSCEIMADVKISRKEAPYAEQLEECFQALHKKYPNLSLSSSLMRDILNHSHHCIKGALYSGGKMTYAEPQDIYPVIDRIGGGDAYMSGLIYGLIHYKEDLEKVINFATATSALKHTIQGDFNSFSADEIKALMEGGKNKNVER